MKLYCAIIKVCFATIKICFATTKICCYNKKSVVTIKMCSYNKNVLQQQKCFATTKIVATRFCICLSHLTILIKIDVTISATVLICAVKSMEQQKQYVINSWYALINIVSKIQNHIEFTKHTLPNIVVNLFDFSVFFLSSLIQLKTKLVAI